MFRIRARRSLLVAAILLALALLYWAARTSAPAAQTPPRPFVASAAQAGAPPTAATLAAATQVDPVDLLTRLSVTAALLLVGGGAMFALCCVGPALAAAGDLGAELGAALQRRFCALALPVTATAALAATLATLGGWPSDGPAALAALHVALGVRSGRVWCALALVLLLSTIVLAAAWLATWRAASRDSRRSTRHLLALGAVGLATQALQSHFADGASFQRTLAGASVMAIHLFAAAVWAGGLAYAALVCWPAWRRSLPPWQSALVGDAIGRFSPLALACVGLLTVSGLLAASRLITPHGLADSLYGGALDLKMALMIVLVALGAANRRTLAVARAALGRASRADRLTLRWQPGAPTGAPGRKLLAAMRKESSLIALTVAAAAVMLDVGPPRPLPTAPAPIIASVAPPASVAGLHAGPPRAMGLPVAAAVGGPAGS